MSTLISRRESTRWPGLFVKKYNRKVFFDNLWNEDPNLLESRGHVETEDGRVVIRPFTKIFNRFENGTDIDRDELCVSVRKINGFMAAATWVDEACDVVVSTTGSLDSDFVALAEEHLTEDVKGYIKAMSTAEKGTYIFEICDPLDPHIIPEETGAWLIGFRPHNEEGQYFSSPQREILLDTVASSMGVKRPFWDVARFSTIVQDARQCHHEGYVVYGQTSKTALKIKSPYYLTMKMAARRKDVMSLDKTRIDEEFYPLVEHLISLGDRFTMMSEQDRLAYMRGFLNG